MADTDFSAALTALRERGAEVFDPVAFHYVKSLAQRMQAHQGEARQGIERSLEDARAALADRCARELADMRNSVTPTATTTVSPLRSLLDDMGVSGDQTQASGAAAVELKVVQEFRGTWSKLSVDHQVRHAIAQAPENAGPLNSHMLVLRSLTQMREISPDYLNRFMSYVDTLMCLDQPDKKVRSANANGQAKRSTTRASRKAK